MSNPSKNIDVVITIANGIASFSYSPEGNIEITECIDIIFSLNVTSKLKFKKPLIAYVPSNVSGDIDAKRSKNKQKLTLSDTDLDSEQIAVQLVIEDEYGNTYASPDPRIINRL